MIPLTALDKLKYMI